VVWLLQEAGALPGIAQDDGTTPLLLAVRYAFGGRLQIAREGALSFSSNVKNGDWHAVCDALLAGGASPNMHTDGHEPPLHVACQLRDVALCSAVLHRGADPDWRGLHTTRDPPLTLDPVVCVLLRGYGEYL
jgi:hypothetical protein